jgi:hypothetical protein
MVEAKEVCDSSVSERESQCVSIAFCSLCTNVETFVGASVVAIVLGPFPASL